MTDAIPKSVPEVWAIVKIGDILSEVAEPIQMKDTEIYRLISIRRRNGGIFERDCLPGNKILTKDLHRVIPGTFLIANRQIVHGACAYVSDEFADAVVSTAYTSLKGNENCNILWFSWIAKTPLLKKYFLDASQGVVLEKMNFHVKEWLEFPIVLPSIPEQSLIATILNHTEALIDQTDRLLQKYQRIKKGLMQDLFHYGIDEQGNLRSEETHRLRDSPLGRVPVEWEIQSLEKMCYLIQDGTHYSPNTDLNGKYKYLTSKNIRFGKMDLSNFDLIDEKSHRRIYNKCPVKKYDVLLTKDGVNTGNATINYLDEEFSILSSVALIRGNERLLLNSFILQFILSDNGQKMIKDSMKGLAISRITLQIIKKFLILKPDLNEQSRIVAILHQVDEVIEKEEFNKQKLIALKAGLMDDLLSGKVRINHMIPAEA